MSNKLNTFFNYPWSMRQQDIMNNQLFRQYSSRDQYFIKCGHGEGKKIYGDAYGNPPKTTWRVEANRFSVGGGPYQWHHMYNRCDIICTENDTDDGNRYYFLIICTKLLI